MSRAGYPSAASVPPVEREWLAFGIWILTSFALVVYGVWALIRGIDAEVVFASIGSSLFVAGIFGVVGFWLRQKRLKAVQYREGFLNSIFEKTNG